jgi:hypothetical protein
MSRILLAVLLTFIVFTFAPEARSQTTVAELNGSSTIGTWGEFSNAGVVDTSSGDIEIDVQNFGGLETDLAQVDFSNFDSTLEVELKVDSGNVANSFVIYLKDTDGIGSDGLGINEVYQYTVDLNGVSNSSFETVSVDLDDIFFNLDGPNASSDADDGTHNYGLIQIGLQSEYASTDSLNITIGSVRIVSSSNNGGGGGVTGNGNTVSLNGRLRVAGNRVMNQFNEPACLAGNSIFWSQWEGAAYYNEETVEKLATDWGSSIVRAAMGVEANGGYAFNNGQFKDREMDKVKALIDGAIAHDVYVIVDFHSHEAENYQAEAIEFFTEISSLYGDYDNIIYEVYNEPISQSWATVKNYAENVIAVIRANDPDNLIVVGSPTWSQDVDIASTNPISDANVAYTLHFYAGTHGAPLRNKAITAMNNGVALFVTEWGSVNADGNGGVDVSSTNQWMDFCRDYELCHANWSIVDKNEGSAVVLPNQGLQGLLNDQLTASGIFVKDIISNWSTFVGKSTSSVIDDRLVFYNESSFDGNDSGMNLEDLLAVAFDKSALLPGQTASFANYTSSIQGLNGMMIELRGARSDVSLADFEFTIGAGGDISTWPAAPAPTGFEFIDGVGDDPDRISMTWANGAITNAWLRVKILANNKTGLAEESIFFFGNVVGETGNSTSETRVNLIDVGATRTNQTGFSSALVDNDYDFDRDGRVNLIDVGIARNNQTGFTSVELISPDATGNRSGNSAGNSKGREKSVALPAISSPSKSIKR